MMKTTTTHHEQEEGHVLPKSIIAMGTPSVNGLCPLKQTPDLGPSPLERGHRVVWIGRDHANQCSAGVSALSRRTKRLSALTCVVSGCRSKKWHAAACA